MTSQTGTRFRRCLNDLPEDIRRLAIAKYRLWQQDPFGPSFHFKEIYPSLWSVRINQNYRALGRRYGDLVVWFWIGTHAEYNRLLKSLM
jgi:hypothetical protein